MTAKPSSSPSLLELMSISKKMRYLWKSNQLIVKPNYEYIVVDLLYKMKYGPLSDKQLHVLYKVYLYDRAVRAEAKALKLANQEKLPTAWAYRRKKYRS